MTRTPKVGERLTTTIQLLEEVFNVTMVHASIMIGDEEIVSANMKIALTDIDSKD